MEFEYSKHALEQMRERGISKTEVNKTLAKPDAVIKEQNKTIYQSVTDKGKYLIRIFVNQNKKPPLIITVYKTSKIKKYHES